MCLSMRLMEERDQLHAARLAELRRDIRAGMDSGSAGALDMKQIKQRARAKFAAQRKSR